MCISDRDDVFKCSAKFTAADAAAPSATNYKGTGSNATVSYTHLTLPTIYTV